MNYFDNTPSCVLLSATHDAILVSGFQDAEAHPASNHEVGHIPRAGRRERKPWKGTRPHFCPDWRVHYANGRVDIEFAGPPPTLRAQLPHTHACGLGQFANAAIHGLSLIGGSSPSRNNTSLASTVNVTDVAP